MISYAIYGEYAAGANKPMQNGLNRRVFNKIEAQSGPDIYLNPDGSITLQPGTYRLTGYSAVTMQTSMAPPQVPNNYPGYCMVYPKDIENSGHEVVEKAIAIGSGATSEELTPSTFDAFYTCDKKTNICVGHQSGDDIAGKIWLSIYLPEGSTPSPFHLMARIAITKI
jgi:hypothetical protein